MSNQADSQEAVADIRAGLYSQDRANALELAAAELVGAVVVTIYNPAVAEERLAFAAALAVSETRMGAPPKSAGQIEETIHYGEENKLALVVVEHVGPDKDNNFWRLTDRRMSAATAQQA